MKYEYMKEYPTNGEKPDLPDDVLIEQFYGGEWIGIVKPFGAWVFWGGVSKFRIVDERYKPQPEKPWRETGDLPPVGWHGEVTWGGKNHWQECVILPDNHIVSRRIYGSWIVREVELMNGVEFRPIRTDRDKFIDAATAVVKSKHAAPASVYENFASALYDEGCRFTTD